jgi:signal transduction histidine kinase
MPSPARSPAQPKAGDSRLEDAWVEAALVDRRKHRPTAPVDRARSLLLLGLLGATAVLLWLRLLAVEPHWPLNWRLADNGTIEVDDSQDPALRALAGLRLQALVLQDGQAIAASTALLPRSARWIMDDSERQRWQDIQLRLSQAAWQPSITLQLEGAADQTLVPRPRGIVDLGPLCWLLCALALTLMLAGAAVVLTGPGMPAWLYAGMAWSQSITLLLIGAESLPGMGLPTGLVQMGLPLRLLADATAAASLVHLVLVYPRRPVPLQWQAWPVWGLALGGMAVVWWWSPPGLWWLAQAMAVGYGLAAAWLLGRGEPAASGPLPQRFQRLVLAGTVSLALLSAAIAMAGTGTALQYRLANGGSAVWSVFFALLLLVGPFLSTSRQVSREITVLAGVSAVALSLSLLSLHLLAPDTATALALALAAALAIYVAARPWIRSHLAGTAALSGERMFDSLYRAARELEQSPDQAERLLSALLREVFDPQEVTRSDRSVAHIRVAADGSTLVVPIARLYQPDAAVDPLPMAGTALVLRHAGRGRRSFTEDDRLLCERLMDQLRRAVAYDRAVEHGRTEERTRLAQDLHDDIGARLLTLMYKAADPEIEEYIRHTLQDLKTLTRGLAASNHRLSHAAAEWKSDITQRLNASGCQLRWDFSADRDISLSVVQWSGLTRVLRELVNNIISHAKASQVEIHAQLERGRLTLHIADDGIGRLPEEWSHGLGLGGVRKRVKLLGGQVHWRERHGRGIQCEVQVPFGETRP